jgi:hypothetical protein
MPVTLSHRTLDVMILPKAQKARSRSACDQFFGMPVMYRLVPWIVSLLGRANETRMILLSRWYAFRESIAFFASSAFQPKA